MFFLAIYNKKTINEKTEILLKNKKTKIPFVNFSSFHKTNKKEKKRKLKPTLSCI